MNDPSVATMTSRHVAWWGLALLALLPLVVLVLRATGGAWPFPQLLPSPDVGVRLSSWRALASAGASSVALAVATAVVSVPAGWVAARRVHDAGPAFRRAAALAAFLPVIAPPVALGIGVQVVALLLGLADRFIGVALAHAIPATGYVVLYFLGVLETYDARGEAEARTLGASPWTCFRRVTFPAVRRAFRDAALLAMLVSWGQLALTLVVGGGLVRALPVEVLDVVRAGDDRLAAIAALLLTVPPLAAAGLLRRAVPLAGRG